MPYSIDQLKTALKSAHQAGDTKSAQRLADEIRKMQSVQQAAPEAGGQEPEPQWSDLPKNAPMSAWKLAQDMATPFMHPIQTADNMLNLAAGGISRGIEAVAGDQSWLPENEATATADAVGEFYSDRYGNGLGGVKKALIEDPFGVVSDVAGVVSGGAGLAAKGVGTAGKISKIGKIARAVDPAELVMKGVTIPAKAAAIGLKEGAGLLTGVGADAITQGVNAAEAGGKRSKAYFKTLRSDGVDLRDIHQEASGAVRNMERARNERYVKDTQSLKANQQPLDLKPVVDEYEKLITELNPQGMWTGGPAAKRTARRVAEALLQVEKNPALKNAEGFDALKKNIASGEKKLGPGASTSDLQSNRIISRMRKTIKKEIAKSDPVYGEAMKAYGEDSDKIKELKKTLALGDNNTPDQAIRALLSSLRNNVSTNFGRRLELVKELEKAGGETLIPKIAGASLNAKAPRGLARLSAPILTGGIGASTIAAALLNPALIPAALATAGGTLAASSPRIVGEIAGAAGVTKRAAKPAIPAVKAYAKLGRALSAAERERLAEKLMMGNQ